VPNQLNAHWPTLYICIFDFYTTDLLYCAQKKIILCYLLLNSIFTCILYGTLNIPIVSLSLICQHVMSSKFFPFNIFVMHRKKSLCVLPTVWNFWDCGIHWHKMIIYRGHFTVHKVHIRVLHSVISVIWCTCLQMCNTVIPWSYIIGCSETAHVQNNVSWDRFSHKCNGKMGRVVPDNLVWPQKRAILIKNLRKYETIIN
jgi:hypothetical protein